jgi:hypothetical protein
MRLGEKQELFSQLLGHLLLFAYVRGYKVRMGEVQRTIEQASKNARDGSGILKSLHIIKLAVDLNLFKDGKYLTESEDHRELGEFWESLDPLCCWGGRWSDGNHYSVTHRGVK